MHTSFTR